MKYFLVALTIMLGPALCRAQHDDAAFDRILNAAVEKLHDAKLMKMSVESRFVFAGRADTNMANYYIVMERDDSLRPGCKLFGFTPRGMYYVYDGDRLLMGYPETGRMTEYRRGRIPMSLFWEGLPNWDLLPRPVSDQVLRSVRDDTSSSNKSVRFGRLGKDSVIILSANREGKEEVERGYFETHLRAADLVPLRCISKYDIEGTGQQYSEVTLNFVAIDMEIEEGLFSGATLPKELELLPPVEHEAAPPLSAGESAPDIVAPTLAGDTLSLSDFRGKVVVLDFFYAACAPCRQAMPKLVELYNEFAGGDVVFLGVNSTDKASSERLRELLESKNIPWPVLLPPQSTDWEYKVSGYPTLIIIDRDGVISASHVGFSKEDSLGEWRMNLKAALAR